MTDTTKSIEVNGNVLGVVNAHPDSNITQNIYNTINPSELITQIKKEDIEKSKQLTSKEKEELEKKFYFIDDSYKTIFNIVCNDLDIKNNGLLRKLYLTMSTISNSFYWLLGNGGEGKSTTLIRLAVENVLKNNSSFYIDFENPSLKDDTVNDMIKHIKNNTNNKAYIFIDNPDIKIDLLAIFYKQIIKNNFEFVIVLAERKNRYYALKNNKDNTLLPLDNFEPISIPSKIKQLVYEKFSKLLGEKNHKIEEIINRTINDKNLAYVNATYKILYELSKTDFIPYKFDWVEYYEIANQRFKSLKNSYKYIAFFYYFRIKVPFSLFERLYTGEEKDLKEFREYYLGINSDEKHKEPIVFDSVKLSPFESKYFMRAKHEIIAELFFDDISGFSNEKFTQIFIDIIKVFDEKDNYQIDCLLQLFGNKRVHLDYTREYKIDFSFIDYIINDEALKNKFKINFNLFGSIFLTRFWTLLETDKKEATKFLEKAVKTIPENLHFKTELAKVYQTQKKYDEAEKVLKELLDKDKNNLQARTELAKVYQTQKKYDEAEQVLKESLEIDNKQLHPRTELAKVYQTQKKYNEAEKVLKELLDKDKNNLQARTELAKVYQTQKKYDEAEKVLKESLEIDNKQLHPRTELAKVYQTQKKYDEAEKVLKESLTINKYGFHAMAGLVRLLSDSSKPRKALEKVNQFLSVEGLRFFGGSGGRAHQALFNNLFFLCSRYKYFDEAKEYFKEYSNILDSRNIKNYEYYIKDKNFTYKDRDITGIVKKIDNQHIIIDGKEYKNYRFTVNVGDEVIFDLDFSHNIRNMEKRK